MLIGLVLYNTRSGDEPTSQHGLISAPETQPARLGRNEGRRHGAAYDQHIERLAALHCT
jgi:hypothetical protein